MTMASKGNKSADATTPLRRFARDSWRSNWNAVPVRVPLTNTEMKKIKLFRANRLIQSLLNFMNCFQSKLGGPTVVQGMGEKNKVWEASGLCKFSVLDQRETMTSSETWRA